MYPRIGHRGRDRVAALVNGGVDEVLRLVAGPGDGARRAGHADRTIAGIGSGDGGRTGRRRRIASEVATGRQVGQHRRGQVLLPGIGHRGRDRVAALVNGGVNE